MHDELTPAQVQAIGKVLRKMRHPWWWRARRWTARRCLRVRLVRVGYLVDVDRDRFSDEIEESELCAWCGNPRDYCSVVGADGTARCLEAFPEMEG